MPFLRLAEAYTYCSNLEDAGGGYSAVYNSRRFDYDGDY